MQIGKFHLSSIEAGEFALDGGAMFGVIPKTIWDKKIPPDERNRIPMRTRLLLITGGGKNILVDTGCGNKYKSKLIDIYKIDHTNFSLEKGLREHSLTTDDITDVILTHLHFDHAGGSTKINSSGKIVPAFAHAKYYVQRSQLEWAKKPSARDKASFFEENISPLIDSGQLVILDGAGEIYPCISVQTTTGHTNGQQHAVITDGKNTLFYCADLIPTFAHIGMPWVMSYDLRPLATMKEKRYVMERAAKENWILFFEHCPLFAAARVRKTDSGFELYDGIKSLL